MGWDSANFRDKGTEGPLLSWNEGTMGQAQNLTKGRDGPGQPVKIWEGMRDKTGRDSLSKSGAGPGTGRYQILTACPFLFRET